MQNKKQIGKNYKKNNRKKQINSFKNALAASSTNKNRHLFVAAMRLDLIKIHCCLMRLILNNIH